MAGRARDGPRLLDRVGVKRPPGLLHGWRVGKLDQRTPTDPGNSQELLQLTELVPIIRRDHNINHLA